MFSAALQTATASAEQQRSELSALRREHQQAVNQHAGALKEVEALHAGHAGAAQRAEESLAELALVRETQAALTAQVLPSPQHVAALKYVAEACNTCWHLSQRIHTIPAPA